MRTQILTGKVEETAVLHIISLKGKEHFINSVSAYRCVDGF
jgi:hypothetical protein